MLTPGSHTSFTLYRDPLNIGAVSPETVGWFRHAEIKHGRVAMFAFVGYLVQANGIHFPFNLQQPWVLNPDIPTISYADISAAGGPADQWDALPTAAKVQIFGMIGFLEWWSESSVALEMDGQAHYVRGGKPGYFPKLKGKIPHTLPFDYFDPFGLSAKASPEKKAAGLRAEINNGRLAQIGIMAFVAEAKVPGSVPSLSGLITPYNGECMAFFSESDKLPFVDAMLAASPFK